MPEPERTASQTRKAISQDNLGLHYEKDGVSE